MFEWIRNLVNWPLVLFAVLLGLLSGCTITGQHGGELYASFGTTVTIGHRTAQLSDAVDMAAIHSQPLEEWLNARANTPATLETTDGETESELDPEGLDESPGGAPDAGDDDSG